MPIFTYKARDKKGNLLTGEIEADSLSKAKIAINAKDLLPTTVLPQDTGITFEKLQYIISPVKQKDLIVFTRQFHSMFKSGLNLNRIFTIIIEQTRNKLFKKTLLQIQADVAKGSSLFKAFTKHPKIFDNIYCSMLAVGEESGNLENVLADLTSLLMKENKLKKGVKSATLYPKIVVFALVALISVAMIYIIPEFSKFYAGFGAELPLPTRILITSSQFLGKYKFIMFAILVIGFILFKRYAKTEKGRLNLDRLKFKLPVFGNLNLLVANARFAHLVGSLYKSGLPILKSLEVIKGAIGNQCYINDITVLVDAISKGKTLSESMRQGEFFTPMLTESTAVGEESGNLDDMLESVSSFYTDEINYTLGTLTTLLEPMLLFIIFGAIAIIALAVYLPMWNISNVILTGG